MSNQTKAQTNPDEVVPRFCGYCGKSFNSNEPNFLVHVNDCEKRLADEYHTKRKMK